MSRVQPPPVALRFGTVTDVDTPNMIAWVRFPGGADPHPVRCVEHVPPAGRKIAVLDTRDRLYYIGAAQ